MYQMPLKGSRGLRAKALFSVCNRLFAASEQGFRPAYHGIPVR